MACRGIGENPEIGKIYDGIKDNLFGFNWKTYNILSTNIE